MTDIQKFFTPELGKEIAKNIAVNAITVVATVGGLVAVATFVREVEKRRMKNRKTRVTQ